MVSSKMGCHQSYRKVSMLNVCLTNLADDILFSPFFTKSIVFLVIHNKLIEIRVGPAFVSGESLRVNE